MLSTDKSFTLSDLTLASGVRYVPKDAAGDFSEGLVFFKCTPGRLASEKNVVAPPSCGLAISFHFSNVMEPSRGFTICSFSGATYGWLRYRTISSGIDRVLPASETVGEGGTWAWVVVGDMAVPAVAVPMDLCRTALESLGELAANGEKGPIT